jgi:hypothetical protein
MKNPAKRKPPLNMRKFAQSAKNEVAGEPLWIGGRLMRK